MRRISLRIFICLIAVMLLLALIVQIVLFTNYPRNVVLRSLEKELHLRAETHSFSTGWFGHTTLRDVSFSLPLSEKPIVSVETLEVRHTSLIPLLFGRDLTISRMEFHHPGIRIARASDGRWNVQQIAQLFGAGGSGGGGGGSSSSGGGSSPPVVLPEVDLIDGTIQIVDGDRQTTIEQLNFKGAPQGLLSWNVDLSIADRVKIQGRLAPGGTWEHQGSVTFNDVAGWSAPWMKLPADLSASVKWRGRFSANGIAGRLDVAKAEANGSIATGGIDVAQSDQDISFRPDNVHVTTPAAAIHQFTAIAGDIRYQNRIVRTQSLQLAAYGGPATLSGYYDFASNAGQIKAGWDQLALPGKILHGGNLTLDIVRPFPTRMVVRGTLLSYATTPQGPWRASLQFGGQDESAADFSWHVDASELVWNRRNPIRLDGLQALGSIHHPTDGVTVVTLRSLQLADKTALLGSGSYSAADRSWVFKASGNRLPLQLLQNTAVGFDLDAAGNAAVISLNHLTFDQARTIVSANGSYRFGIPKPVNATVTLSSPPVSEYQPGAKPLIEGAMRGSAKVEGTLLPLKLDLQGNLYGRGVRIASRDIGDLALRVTGAMNPDYARLETERLRALGGDWSLRTTYVFADELLDTDLRVEGLPLEDLATATDSAPIHGTLAGEWDAYFPQFPLNLRNFRLSGGGWIQNPKYHGLYADELHFTTTMDQGVLSFDPITTNLGTGRGSGSMKWNIDRPNRAEGKISLTAWPMQLGKAVATGTLDVPALAISLPVAANATTPATPLQISAESVSGTLSLQYEKRKLGDFAVTGYIDGRVASITDLHGSLIDAPITATGEVDLANPLHSHGQASFEKLDTSRLAAIFPQTTGLSGTLRGVASLGPLTAARPLEPLAFHLQTNFEHGTFRSLPIGIWNLNAFVNTNRVVLDDRPGHDSTLQVAGGNVRLWGRLAHAGTGLISSQLELQLEALNLDQITRCVNPQSKPTPGSINGNVMLLYNSRSGDAPPPPAAAGRRHVASPELRKFVQTLYGESSLSLTGLSVATVPLISNLYDVLSLGQAGNGPIGQGSLEARLENGTLFISNVHYFNRGTEALLQLTSSNMWDLPHNSVEGSAIASLRPLTALKLPLVADIQSALDALQGDVHSYRISGPWNNMRTTPVGLSSLGKEMRDLLIGNINNSNHQQDLTPQQ